MASKKKPLTTWLSARGALASAVIGVFLVGVSLSGYFLFTNRTKYHWYHLLSLALRGDVALQRTLAMYNVHFVPVEQKTYVDDGSPTTSFSLKWRFRPSHAVPTYPIPPIDDTNGDGIPEVYVASYTKVVYALNGHNGRTLWSWKLPFGVVGGRALALVKLGHRPRKALIVGTHTTLPIRVYALDVEQERREADRLLWVRNVSGDFIEGGLNVARNSRGDLRIVAATRDAPYSRGSLNILDARGKFVFPPFKGLDVCLNRPGIGDLNGDGKYDLIHGSHNFYNAKEGFSIVAREVDSGNLLWKRKMDFDTGARNHAIFDYDGDGKQDVIVNGWRKTVVLDGTTGELKKLFPLEYAGRSRSESGEPLLLMKEPNRLVVMRASGKIVYSLKRHGSGTPIVQDSFGVRLADRQHYSLMVFSHDGEKLHLVVYDLETGREKERLWLYFEYPPKGPGSLSAWYGVTNNPSFHAPWEGFVSLADIDADGFWEVLFQAEDYLYAIDTPFKIAKGYNPYAPIPFRNINNAGVIFISDKDHDL